MKKIAMGIDVLTASRQRLEWVFDTFEQVCVSFSGGKDSTVLFHLTAEVARQKRRTFVVLFIDWEAQFSYTIMHIEQMLAQYQDVIERDYWVALPLTTVNGVSQLQPEWVAWAPKMRDQWVREPPKRAITDVDTFPFYHLAMTFEEFVPAFAQWLAKDRLTMMLVGIRTEESLNRLLTISSQQKRRYADDKPWTTAYPEGLCYSGYPIYDWKVRDIWTYHARSRQRYNPLYDLMYRAGVVPMNMRICEPFGPEQRRGLWLYHVVEPQTWARVCSRVAGASSGAHYGHRSGAYFAANTAITKPAHHTWRSYAHFLLAHMPQATAEHYRTKIAVYLKWYQTHGYPVDIPDAQAKDLGSRDVPSAYYHHEARLLTLMKIGFAGHHRTIFKLSSLISFGQQGLRFSH